VQRCRGQAAKASVVDGEGGDGKSTHHGKVPRLEPSGTIHLVFCPRVSHSKRLKLAKAPDCDDGQMAQDGGLSWCVFCHHHLRHHHRRLSSLSATSLHRTLKAHSHE